MSVNNPTNTHERSEDKSVESMRHKSVLTLALATACFDGSGPAVSEISVWSGPRIAVILASARLCQQPSFDLASGLPWFFHDWAQLWTSCWSAFTCEVRGKYIVVLEHRDMLENRISTIATVW